MKSQRRPKSIFDSRPADGYRNQYLLRTLLYIILYYLMYSNASIYYFPLPNFNRLSAGSDQDKSEKIKTKKRLLKCLVLKENRCDL